MWAVMYGQYYSYIVAILYGLLCIANDSYIVAILYGLLCMANDSLL